MPNYIHVITPHGTTRAWSLLRAGVPLSLLCDLADPTGPRSREIYTCEVVADDVARDLDGLTSGTTHPSGGSIQLPEVSIYTA